MALVYDTCVAFMYDTCVWRLPGPLRSLPILRSRILYALSLRLCRFAAKVMAGIVRL